MAVMEHATVRNRGLQRFIDALRDPNRVPLPAHDIAVVVAHPDDETISCGAQLRRFKDATIIVVTDGAPRNLVDARTHGLASTDSYAAIRSRELCNALALGRVANRNIITLGISDQMAALRLVDLARTTYRLLAARQIRIVLTHAYEGGHPDHDATAFAVHAAVALMSRRGEAISILEMPFYRARCHGPVTQSFAPYPGCPESTLRLTEPEQSLKRSMIAEYSTQTQTLSPFDLETERFRPAPTYDFASLPNDGRLLYEQYAWGMTGQRWLTLARGALAALGLGDKRWL